MDLEETKDWFELYHDCVTALQDYMREANMMCATLSRVHSLPASAKKRHEILEQRKRENDALERYHKARRRLFDNVPEARH
jgi:hypothetical protein